ncbi:MAG: D-alanine--D-alanine ligase family protein [Trueperaceae bacterium]|nr:D-alanine--D-alanine ligase family protein [Trueperaceae bacterium]
MMCNLHMDSRERRTARRRRVLLLCGGRSGEHDVSLASAASVLAAAEGRMDLVPRVIHRDGRLLSEDASRRALAAGDSRDVRDEAAAPDLIRGLATTSLADVDAVFPLLHGPNGEDGTVQGLLRVAGVPFVGSDVLGSAAAMDKATMKRVFAADGLPQVAWGEVSQHAWAHDPAAVAARLAALPWPRFVKPANLGSSVGIGRADDAAGQDAALREAFRHDRRAVVEAAVVGGREIEVAVLGNDDPQAAPAGEIRVVGDAFYDYEHKYTEGGAELVIPADVPADTAATLRRLAIRAFELVDAAGLARVDFFLTAAGEVLVNEINTIPGFTRLSMYPRLWAAAGVAYPDLIERLVELAVERHGRLG